MSQESDYRDVRKALRYTSEALKDSAKESKDMALALERTTTELGAVKKELERARNDREDFASRLTTLESSAKGLHTWIGFLVAAAGVAVAIFK